MLGPLLLVRHWAARCMGCLLLLTIMIMMIVFSLPLTRRSLRMRTRRISVGPNDFVAINYYSTCRLRSTFRNRPRSFWVLLNGLAAGYCWLLLWDTLVFDLVINTLRQRCDDVARVAQRARIGLWTWTLWLCSICCCFAFGALLLGSMIYTSSVCRSYLAKVRA